MGKKLKNNRITKSDLWRLIGVMEKQLTLLTQHLSQPIGITIHNNSNSNATNHNNNKAAGGNAFNKNSINQPSKLL